MKGAFITPTTKRFVVIEDNIYETTPIRHVSLEVLEELDIDLGDGGQESAGHLDRLTREEILGMLTPEMREVAELLEQGYQQKEIAQIRGTTKVAVWKSAERMRARLRARGVEPTPRIR